MSQLSLGGWARARAGMKLADDAERQDWKVAADEAIRKLAARGVEFTAAEVRELVGDPTHPNAFGARFNAASGAGLIVKVGYRASNRPSLHSHPVAVWKGAA